MAGAAGLSGSWAAILSRQWLRPRDLPGPLPYIVSAMVVAVPTIAAIFAGHYGLKHAWLLPLAAVVVNAMQWGLAPSLFSAVLSVVVAVSMLHWPELDPRAIALDGLIDLVVFCGGAAIVSDLVARLRQYAADATRRDRAAQRLQEFSRTLAGIADADELYLAVIEQLERSTGRPVLLLLPEHGQFVVLAGEMHDRVAPPMVLERANTLWARRDDVAAPAEALAEGWRLRQLRTWRGPIGVIAIADEGLARLAAADLSPMLDQAAVAIERTQLARAIADSRLQEARERLQEALINSVSHSLQTPLAVIIGSATSLQALAGPGEPSEKSELVATIREEAERLERFVGKILQMTRIRAGAIAPRLELVELPDIINAALFRLRRTLAGRAVDVKLPQDLPMLRLDLILMEEAIANLIENAAKYSPRGARIAVEAKVASGGKLVLDVVDSGPGIAAESLPRIFDPFYRAGGADTKPPGTGLGLAICRAFVEANRGRIEVATGERARGTVFRLTLPIPEEVIAEEDAMGDD